MRIFTAIILIIIPSALLAQNSALPVYHVKYVTGENVYIDAGSADSLAVGDRLAIKRADSSIAQIEIAFVADHSASCKIVGTGQGVMVGDLVQQIQATTPPPQVVTIHPVDTTAAVTATAQPVQVPQTPAKRPGARLDGSVAVQVYRFSDLSPAKLNFTQPSMRVNLRASRLFGQDMTLTIRSDSRYNLRDRAYSMVPKSEMRNRIYQFSLSYGSDQSPYNFQVGRIISNKFSGVGYIDGFLAQRRVAKGLQFGAFGGTQPQWQYSEFQTAMQKYGAFGSLEIGDYQHNRLESIIAIAGEYHGGTVSREFFFLRNSLNLGRAWSLYLSSDIDINRSWRKEKTGQSLTMSNLYLSARGRLSPWLQTGLSFDSRKNYWTYETRSLADSLFDSVLREGLRADVTVRPGKTFTILANYGYNKRTTDLRATHSGGGGINIGNFLASRQFLNIQYSGFTSSSTDGHNGTITFGRYIWAGNLLSVVFGTYSYTFTGAGGSRSNRWIQANGMFDLVRRTYLSASYEYDTGDDTKGHRIIGEMGYRF